MAWQTGAFDPLISPMLLAEVRRAIACPKLERLVAPADADAFVEWIGRSGELVADPKEPPRVRSHDPDDDYLIAVAANERALLVSGDVHLTSLANRVPVRTPAEFLAELDAP